MTADSATTSGVTMVGILPFVFVFTQSLISAAALGSVKLRDAARAPKTDSHTFTKSGASLKCRSAHNALAMVSDLRRFCKAADDLFKTPASAFGSASAFLMAVRVDPADPFS